MARRRVYAELEPWPEGPERPAPVPENDVTQEPEPEPADAPHAQLIALQRGAGNAATGRLLRGRAASAGLAREPDPAAPAQGFPSGQKPPVDIFKIAPDPAQREITTLHTIIVPQILDRLLIAPDRIGTRESLAEITVLARDELAQFLTKTAGPGAAGPATVVSPVEAIQNAVIAVAKRQNVIVPGHRFSHDPAGLASEAKALANLAGIKLPDAAIEGTAAGFKFRFDGQLSASGKIGGTAVEGKVGSDSAEAKVGPATATGTLQKDKAAVDVKLVAGPVDFKANITAKAGEPTTWSGTLEIKLGGGAAAVPDATQMAGMIQAAGHDLEEAATYLRDAVAGKAAVTKTALEEKIKPARESIEKVAGYIEQNKAKPPGTPGATLGVTAKGSETGAVSAQVTLTITF